jgi:hypothetical protein
MKPRAAAQKKFTLVWRCHQLLSESLANGHLLRVSQQSLLSANTKDDSEVKRRTVYRSHAIYLRAEEFSESLS